MRRRGDRKMKEKRERCPDLFFFSFLGAFSFIGALLLVRRVRGPDRGGEWSAFGRSPRRVSTGGLGLGLRRGVRPTACSR